MFDVTLSSVFLDNTNPFRFVLLFWGLTAIFFNNAHGLYHTRREMLESIEIMIVLKSVFLSALMTAVAIYIMKIEGFPRSIFLLSAIFTGVFFSVWRICKRVFVEHLVTRGYNNFNVLIIGAGKVGTLLAQEIESRPGLGLNIVGFLDDFKTDENAKGKRLRILGKTSDFRNIAQREFITKVFITIHHDNGTFLKILEQAKELGIAVRVVPPGFDLTTGHFSKYNIGFVPILEYGSSDNFKKQVGKGLFDFVISLCAFLFLLPIFIAIGILIKLDSPGPVFYVSKRYGRRGKMFYMYKFRSMVKDAEKSIAQIREKNEVDGPIFKIRNDPRITRVGRLLRKFSLDELPQIINVFKGEMSLVGPRPLPIDQIEKEDLRQLKRLEVRPGITGLWQIRGRSDISFSRLVKWDIWYINNWSLWLDVNILLQTVPVVVRGKGAY